MVWAALSYLIIGTLALWPSIRPGRTLVPADALNIVTPYSALRADGVFRGVVVPAGRHTVAFTYRNPEEMQGRWVAGVAAVVILGLGLTRRGSGAGVNRKGLQSD